MREHHEEREVLSLRTAANYPVGSRPLLAGNKIGARCPKCRSEQVRGSTSLSITERLLGLLGRVTLRCDSCYHRWQHWIPK